MVRSIGGNYILQIGGKIAFDEFWFGGFHHEHFILLNQLDITLNGWSADSNNSTESFCINLWQY